MAALVGAFAVLLFAIVATSDPVPVAERAPSLPFSLPEIDLDDEAPTTTLPAGASSDEATTPPGWKLITWGFEHLVLAGLAVAIVALLVQGWRKRPRLVWHRREPPPVHVVLEEVADQLVEDAEEQRAALRRGSARNAIVECWLRLEAAIAAAGVELDPALTPTELTTNVLDRFEIDAGAADRLASLYREARFSTHELGERHRTAALDALDHIHDGLRRSRHGSRTPSP